MKNEQNIVYFIVNIDKKEGEPKLYNKDNNSWHDFCKGEEATAFINHDEAEEVLRNMQKLYGYDLLFIVTAKMDIR